VFRHYTVFNAQQCEGIEAPAAAQPGGHAGVRSFTPIESAAAIVADYKGGQRVEHQGADVVYRPREDLVRIAPADRFVDAESYYTTLFHELVHSTGHSSRLDRGLDANLSPFGSPDYSKEELVTEMGAAFLAAAAGISSQTIEQSAAYIDGWRRKLSSDTKLVIQAAGAAQKASDCVLGERERGPAGP